MSSGVAIMPPTPWWVWLLMVVAILILVYLQDGEPRRGQDSEQED